MDDMQKARAPQQRVTVTP